MNTNIFSTLLNTTTDNKTISAGIDRGMKRVAVEQNESQAKRSMLDHHSKIEQGPIVVPKSFDKPKFVSAADMIDNARANMQAILEISDEELLAMAVDFEKKYPQ
ncbi:unnamed protein product [Adineta steineri]|nr:unnamed protein product [Adineta steineri]CAF1245819.1 unnamed protein product [Adineta steineri]